jgi:hypothetical protein
LHFVLQEQGCEAGDHIVRARGAWFGNRSISAEVDLEAGIYEVVPKIEAFRDADAPAVEEVVVKVAERNPQKLRQIGLNYDIANAKGASELTEEQKKKQEQKKKEAAEKKKKKLEEEAKEQEDFENWKKEEKAEYEAWKRDRVRQSKLAPQEVDSKPETQNDEAKDVPKLALDQPVEIKVDAPSPSKVAEDHTEVKDEPTKTEGNDGATKTDVKDEATKIEPAEKEPAPEPKPETSDDDTHPPHYAASHGPPSMMNGPGPYRRHPESVYGLPVPPPPRSEHAPADNTPKPWNAVCVLGLRVYSQDSEVSIKLVKPKDAEEGAILDVDGDTMAGATM